MQLREDDQGGTFEANWDKRFRELYEDKGLMKGERCLPIHEACECRDSCWKGDENRYPEGKTALIARPWIGEYYAASGLMAIGINLNTGGGFSRIINEVGWARSEMKEGRRKVFKQSGYGGSFLHPCLGSYAAALLAKMGIVQVDAVGAFDYLAYAQHVKCSPRDENRRGRPYPNMWGQCGKHILSAEIKKLNPRMVLILGKSDNWIHTCNLFGSRGATGQLTHVCWTTGGEGQLLIGVRHPMAFGGPQKQTVLNELAQVDLEPFRVSLPKVTS